MSPISHVKDAVIIGGGICGLATAYRLHEAGLDILVLEKSARVGGAVHTERAGDYLIDYGPNSTLETSPKIRTFINELGLANARIEASSEAKKRYILRQGQLLPLPMSPPTFVTSKLLSWKAKMRVLAEPFISPAPADHEETIAQFVRRRLGPEVLDYAVNPFIAGVFAGDPAKLSVASALPKLHALEKNHGGLIKGAVRGARERKKRPETAKTKARLFSFRDGMGQLTETLAAVLSAQIETSCEIEAVALGDGNAGHSIAYVLNNERFRIEALNVVFTTPAFVTAQFLCDHSAAVAKVLTEISYPPVTVVFFGFNVAPRCRPLDGFGLLVPEVERRNLLGTIWSSTLFGNRAPRGGLALTTFVGGSRQPEITELRDDTLREIVAKELSEVMNLTATPDIVKIKRWPRAIPQYELGHARRMVALERFEQKNPGVLISGNFRNGIALGDCIINSEEVAAKVMRHCNVAGAQGVFPERTVSV